MLLKILTTFLLLITVLRLNAQDANYWSSSYGPGGFFTPGAVIANNHDTGVLFYNPALLAYDKKNAASISGTIYQLESIKIKNAVGKGLHLKSGGENIVPLIASHTIHLKTKRPFTLVYALVHSSVINYQASQYKSARMNVLKDSYSPGNEDFIGQYTMGNGIKQTTALASAGFKIAPKMAAGISTEVQIRNQSYLLNYSSKAIINNGDSLSFPPISMASEYYLANTRHIGLRLKAGLSYDISNAHHLGLVISSPLVHLSGKSGVMADLQVNNLRFTDTQDLNLLANTRQEKLSSKWKMPLSTALGYIYHHTKGELYVVAEYFGKVKEYDLIQPNSGAFIREDTLNTTFTSAALKFKDVRRGVLNVALGASMFVKPDFTGYLSLRTDFSYAHKALYRDEDGYTANTTWWHNYHCQLGANIKRKRYNIRSGLLLTYGSSSKVAQSINFDNPSEANLLLGELHNSRGTHILAGIIVSYIHNL